MTAPRLSQRRRIADEATVAACLAEGLTVAQVEQATGWPAHAIRKLVSRRRWWITPRGTVEVSPPDLCTMREPGTLAGYREHLLWGEKACGVCMPCRPMRRAVA